MRLGTLHQICDWLVGRYRRHIKRKYYSDVVMLAENSVDPALFEAAGLPITWRTNARSTTYK